MKEAVSHSFPHNIQQAHQADMRHFYSLRHKSQSELLLVWIAQASVVNTSLHIPICYVKLVTKEGYSNTYKKSHILHLTIPATYPANPTHLLHIQIRGPPFLAPLIGLQKIFPFVIKMLVLVFYLWTLSVLWLNYISLNHSMSELVWQNILINIMILISAQPGV